MDKREFLKTGVFGALGLAALPAFAGKRKFVLKSERKFGIPELPYAYDALEPYIDTETMRIHHLEHHSAFAEALNSAFKNKSIPEGRARGILKNASAFSGDIVHHAGGFVNHKIFWKSLSPNGGGEPNGDISLLIKRDFGTFKSLREQFDEASKTKFGSGWAWLVIEKGKLKVVTTANLENPLMNTLNVNQKGHPLLCLDLWEHAYYQKYQNQRSDYIDSFWNIVNWESANQRLANSKNA